ncbi:glyoxalase family protein [Luminiphilus syltensis NOR5-1B]|uniref:Glyoxalase family protein n=1 Tax=Luminiphilus syltensis NOR5-1B TaxID=565045 RepID=B8KY82_9GAMM|nr:VOC family protein [Luminiphilus syltensis]EED34744.1 glyoxalase family protein [Luminiphilus syltensis NOR5-1B]
MIKGIHHINLLVRDLDDAVARYRAQLGLPEPEYERLPGRGVETARFRIGESYLVLVMPTAEGEPARVLAEQGEGLFLLSLTTDDIEESMKQVVSGGGALTSEAPRAGVSDWRIIDLEPEKIAGGRIQLANSRA